MKKKTAIPVAAAATLVAAAALYFTLRPAPAETGTAADEAAAAKPATAKNASPAKSAGRSAKRAAANRQTARKAAASATAPAEKRKPSFAAILQSKELTPGEKKSLGAIQDALDRDDAREVIALARALARDKSARVRSRAVEALGWFGKQAIPELVPFMADPEEDVANDAHLQFEQAISELEDEHEIAATVAAAMNVVDDPDALEMLAAHLHGLDNAISIAAISSIVSGGGPGADAAKEAYNFITGEDWTDAAAAQAWLDANPRDQM